MFYYVNIDMATESISTKFKILAKPLQLNNHNSYDNKKKKVHAYRTDSS